MPDEAQNRQAPEGRQPPAPAAEDLALTQHPEAQCGPGCAHSDLGDRTHPVLGQDPPERVPVDVRLVSLRIDDPEVDRAGQSVAVLVEQPAQRGLVRCDQQPGRRRAQAVRHIDVRLQHPDQWQMIFRGGPDAGAGLDEQFLGDGLRRSSHVDSFRDGRQRARSRWREWANSWGERRFLVRDAEAQHRRGPTAVRATVE